MRVKERRFAAFELPAQVVVRGDVERGSACVGNTLFHQEFDEFALKSAGRSVDSLSFLCDSG
jgi:hypothetical protein